MRETLRRGAPPSLPGHFSESMPETNLFETFINRYK